MRTFFEKGMMVVAGCLVAGNMAAVEPVLVEAEAFNQYGGWVLDTQFIEIMGSPYLLAHGLGQPVADAVTTVEFPATGTYRVWVRTKDWVARWNAPGTPGRFQLFVDGKPLQETFGTRGADWFWHDGGTVEIKQRNVQLALHDLTGFDGRCDAILFGPPSGYTPPADMSPLAGWRRQLRGLPVAPQEAGTYDLVVVGGGIAGTAAAISGARMGCKTVLIQNRPVLGGNGSSEVRVWPQGGTRRGLFPRLGEIVEEIVSRPKSSPGTYEEFEDARKEEVVRAEKNITLRLNHHVLAVEKEGNRISAVIAMDTRTGLLSRFRGRLFADCTGHGTVGALAGADHTIKEEGHLGMSNMWRWRTNNAPVSFPETPWALDLTMDDFPYPKRFHGEWFWESGFNRHPINDLEYTRDWNLRAVFGAFNAMKNKDGKAEHATASLEWVAYIGGTRESRQLLGDVVLTRDDIVQKRQFPDGCVPTTWDIDLHYPKEQYAKKYPQDPFISKAEFDKSVDKQHGYPVPYRCFYSRNIENLFMAGRNVSVTHEALGTVRVMRTGGMIGEVVGKAASICIKHICTPREVYERYFDELKELINLPGAMRRDTVNDPLVMPPNAPALPPPDVVLIEPSKLPGIVVDDTRAKLTGKWTQGQGLKGYIGPHYLYAAPREKAVARFEFSVPVTGEYEVRSAHQPHENRSSKTLFTIYSASGQKTVRVNQKIAAPLPNGFVSLGVFNFEAGKPYAVEISTDGADGNVHADAIQILKK